MGFDQTGTRSWTFKASSGNLNLTSGDGNGFLTGQINASTLDSIDSSQFLRSDVADTKNSGHLTFNDNVKAQFGGSGDLQIYHDASNSRIDNTLGSLIIKNTANDQDVILSTDDGSGGTTTYVRCDGSAGQVDLTHYGTTKLSTASWGVNVQGELECDSIDCDGNVDVTGDAVFRGGGGAVSIAGNSDIRFENGSWTGNTTSPKIQAHGNWLYIAGGSSGIAFRENGTDRFYMDGSGHVRPATNNTYDLGNSSYRWRNVYTNDLNLSNEGSTNEVDGSWGDWTIQEGEDDLFLINRRNGKKYAFVLREVN